MEALHGINDFDEFDGVTRHVPSNAPINNRNHQSRLNDKNSVR